MTDQQLNDVWTYRLTESMESAIISDCEGFTVGHIVGVGLFPKKSTEKLAWRIVTDHNLGLLAAHAAQREGGGVPDYINQTIDNLRHYNYEMSYGGYLKHTRDVELIRAYVARTRQITPQPIDAAGFTLGPVSDGGMDPRDRQPAPDVALLVEALERIENLDSTAYHSLDLAKITARNALAAHRKENRNDGNG